MASRASQHSRGVEAVARICAAADGERALRVALIEEVRRHVAFDFYAWLLTDPETTVGSAPLAATPSLGDLPRLIQAKYLTTVNRWTSLDGVATLWGATGGDRSRSLIWRELWSSYGVEDVASMAFRDQHGCWGFLDLWRTGEGTAFSSEEVGYLEAIAGSITEGLRRALAATFDGPGVAGDRSGPVVLMLSPSLSVKAQTPDTDAYLRALVPPEGDQRPIPAGAYNVGAQLLAVEAGVDEHPPYSRVHLRGGEWMTLRAARVADPASQPQQDIAVTIEPCSLAERRWLYSRSHGLTRREAELLDRLALGADTRAIAETMFLSEYTVQDYLKSIFAKTGARNRRTLLARVAGR